MGPIDDVRELIGEASIQEADERWNRILAEERFIAIDALVPFEGSGSPREKRLRLCPARISRAVERF